MKKEFLLNIIFLVVANLLIKPLYLLWIEVEVNNIVGPSIYGIYASIFSLCYVFQIIADPGLLNFNTTQISSDRTLVHERLSVMLGLKLILAILFTLSIFGIARILGYNDLQWSILPWVIANIVLISFNLFLRSNISSLGKYRWDSVFSILDKALMIIIFSYLIYYTQSNESFTIINFVQGQTLAYGLTTILLFVYIGFKNIRFIPVFKFRAFAQIIRKSLPFAWLLFLMTIYTRIDTFMLERLLDDSGYQAGLYASAFRLYDAGNSFSFLVAVLLLPMFSNMLSQNKSIKSLFGSSFSLVYSGLIAVSFISIFYSQEIMQFFYPKDATVQYGMVFSLLLLSLIPISLAYISGTLLTAGDHLRKLNQLAFIGVIANILLNLILIPITKANGAATATLATQSIMTILQFAIVIKIFKINPSIKNIAIHLVYGCIVLSIGYLGKSLIPGSIWLNFAICIIISLIIALIFRIIDLRPFWIQLKTKITSE